MEAVEERSLEEAAEEGRPRQNRERDNKGLELDKAQKM